MKQRSLWASVLLAAIGVNSVASAATNAVHTLRHPIGLQLYSLRHQFENEAKPGKELEHEQNIEKNLKLVRSYGVRQVELASTYGLPPEKFRKMLDAAGLRAVSEHVSLDRLHSDIEGVAKEAQILGLRFVGVAWVPHEGVFDYKKAKETAADFNKIGEALSKHNILFFDHCHGYEWDPKGASPDGLKAVDVLMRETNPRFVAFQMDTFWVKFPGEDPAAWLRKYPGRWRLMHIKDMKKGLETGKHNGGTDVNNDVAAGTGQLDWADILSAAQKAGTQAFFIEDESDAALTQIPLTLGYLKQLPLDGGK